MMNRLNAQLWLGSAEDAADAVELRRSGVTAVLNITKEPDPEATQRLCVYAQLDHDDGVPFPAETLAHGLGFLQSAVATNQVVLIHCAAGISRTAAMAIAFLMTAGFSWDEAEPLVRAARFYIAPHPELKRSVLQFLKRWPYDGSMAA